jgi:phosphatidylinositol alpha-1,6-mannosyltransferase
LTRVLLVSKPIAPPWNDSSKNLARDLALGVERAEVHLMGTGAEPFSKPNVIWERVYREAGDFAPGLRQNARALRRVACRDPAVGIYHFFFAPNPTTSAVLRAVMRLKRQRTVHTVCSRPFDPSGSARLLFADRVVAVSDDTAAALRSAGVPGVTRIYPSVEPERLRFEGTNALARELGLEGLAVALFAGDIEVEGVVSLLTRTAVLLHRDAPTARLVVAVRDKTRDSRPARAALERELHAAGVRDAVVLLGQVDRMDQLLALTSVAVLPVPTLHRKMDLPLILLEALGLGIPIVVSDLPPLLELLRSPCGWAVPVGDAAALAATLSRVLADAELRARAGAAGRSAVLREFSIRAAARAYEEIYGELEHESAA